MDIQLVTLDDGQDILEYISSDIRGTQAVGFFFILDPDFEQNLYMSSQPFTLEKARTEWDVKA
ncbi:MAG: hypothetical protein ABSF90_26655 [Syntrophobacteraceae bacterium]|jgi:hypothetical protein